jgi:hypothetical protein
VDLEGFQRLYGNDPLYHWIGFDSPLMYAAHKAAGGMTSLYRQLGVGCEILFRQILLDRLRLTPEQVAWQYEVIDDDGRRRTLALDGRIDLANVADLEDRSRITDWLNVQKRRLRITTAMHGVVFEVRQGYRSQRLEAPER